MKSYKPLFLFMLSLSLISIAAKAEDAAKPPPPSEEEIAQQRNYEKLLKHLKPFHSVEDLKKYNFEISASGGDGKMDQDSDSNDCPKGFQVKVFGPFAKMTIRTSDNTEDNYIITQDQLKMPRKFKDIPEKFNYFSKDEEGRLVLINQDGVAYVTVASSSALFQEVSNSDASAFSQRGLLPVPKPGSGCILSLENRGHDSSVKSARIAGKLEGRHLAVIDDAALKDGLNHDAH